MTLLLAAGWPATANEPALDAQRTSAPVVRINPFVSPHATSHNHTDGAQRQRAGGIVLKGVLAGGDFPMANISGEVVGVGETVQGYEVVEVSEAGVLLKDGQREIKLVMHEEQADD